MDLAKLMTQLPPNSRLPGRHSKAQCSHKDGANVTSIWSLFFLHIMTHIQICNATAFKLNQTILSSDQSKQDVPWGGDRKGARLWLKTQSIAAMLATC